MKIAFIGLGNMGGGMAANQAKAGHQVSAFDLSPAALDRAASAGCTPVASVAEAVRDADIVITVLPAGPHVLKVYSESIIGAAPSGALLIDCSTIDVDTARKVASVATEAGYIFADAPMSGGTTGADAGTLAFMVGCPEDHFARVEAALEPMSRATMRAGDHGAGQAAKICNNMILGVSMIAVSEAFVLGEKLGLTHQALFDVASAASGQCWALTTNCPVPGPVPSSPANRDYQPGFSSALMAKDLNLALNALHSTGVAGQMGALAARIYDRFAAEGGAGRDFSAIITDIRGASEHHAGDRDSPAGEAAGTELPGRRRTTTAHDDGSPE